MARVRALAAFLSPTGVSEYARVTIVTGCALALVFAGQTAPFQPF